MSSLRLTDEVIDAVMDHAKKGVVAIYNSHKMTMRKKLY